MANPSSERGRRLLPSLVDEIARSDPSRILYSICKTGDPADGFRDVNARTFARAVDRCSWYLERQLGRGLDFPTAVYMGPQDLMYAIVLLACVKVGYKLLLSSPRNSLEAHLSLLTNTDCDIFLSHETLRLPVVRGILAERPMKLVDIADYSQWLDDGAVMINTSYQYPTYPYNRSFEDARLDPFVVLHTSGSTGLPKAVVLAHGTLSPLDAFAELQSLGKEVTYPAMCAGSRVYVAFPMFHCAGISMLLPAPIYGGFTVVLGPFPPSAAIVNAMHVHGNVQHSCLPPAILAELADDPEHLKNVSRLEQVTFGGGPLTESVGDLVTMKTKLLNCLGTTECGVLPSQYIESSRDWKYLSFSHTLGSQFQHHVDDLYEHVIIKDDSLALYQGVFATFPELCEWRMRDLYKRHPTDEDSWLYKGRVDDVIVYSNGEKLNPLSMEQTVSSNTLVRAALIAGVGKFQSSLLLEVVDPPTTEEQSTELLETIWPSVQAANKQAPSHAWIHRDMIIFTKPEKPMLRAGKGTVQRKLTLELYDSELEQLYAPKAAASEVQKASTEYSQSAGGIDINRILASHTHIDVKATAETTNLFDLGLDSLQVKAIVKELNRQLNPADNQAGAEARLIYANPTIKSLAAVSSSLVHRVKPEVSTVDREQEAQKLFEGYAAEIPINSRPSSSPSSEKLVVMLTGSTGCLGSYILNVLLSNPHVSQVYCLNRGAESATRQHVSSSNKGLSTVFDKVVFLECDLSQPCLGLDRWTYKMLQCNVTNIIHNAWQVDFNLSLESLSKHVHGVRRLIDFSALSVYGACLFFISSIGAVANWPTVMSSLESIPEEPFEKWSIPQKAGYGESKFISERLLDASSRTADVAAAICRVGQIAGPTASTGVWPKQEWLPSLIASSKYLGKLPASLGQMDTIDWIPVDLLGEIIVGLALDHDRIRKLTQDEGVGAVVYHTANPHHISWDELLPTVVSCLDGMEKTENKRSIEVVSLHEWLRALRESQLTTRPSSASSIAEEMAKNPAAKLIEFYEELESNSKQPVILETLKTEAASPMLTQIGPVTKEWMTNWMDQWKF